ncbi:lactonase family protein [Klebsiella quasipneumoniae]|nr:lactonase family protein [Klebsiella quasipneumoniae]MBZ7872030.1 lactonase family protein [Klebsiella quasipneumoniae]MCB3857124.1 lactonase family protein [Klebsiella quasipneumoniae]PLD49767.1 3-carboxymuconate cyclase [Klebsiella quasipneumoniae]PLM29356.1 lactonase family protein [Klebsiella quasipneumoniae]UBH77211.1 lactonase family protein [Klebsiella quasipneumoniae]
MTTYAYIGCRTSAWRGARGKGISVYRISDSGTWELLQSIASVQDNPSWLTLDLPRNRLYVLHGDGDRVAVFNRDPDSGLLSLFSDQTTGPRHSNPDLDPARRNNPVGASLTPDGNTLLIANHEGGNIAALPVSVEGLEPPVHLATIEGHTAAQATLSRPHEIVFAPGSALFAVPVQGRKAGNGIDMIRLYHWEQTRSCLADEVHLPEGSWPRHVDFHPNGKWMYAISELSSTVTVYHVNQEKGTISLKQTLSALPDGYESRSDASEIEVHPSGRFVYAANRGHDSIAVFSINQQDGSLMPTGWVPCGGKTPRFTTLSPDGSRFFSANEDSDTIQVFDVDSETGMLSATKIVIATASPTCICFA